jgi:hypothetical protein
MSWSDFRFSEQTIDSYFVAGLIYHLGPHAHSGHYRAVLRTHDRWMAYEDNRLPDQYQELPAEICANIVLIFLIPEHAAPIRQRAVRNAEQRNAASGSAGN